ncbi:bifunctional 2',3'-cyclic-nucleotide 2'-phosphodiesterase/3'-nucleotidase [Psittacicella hinzii]|uniref:2',3'-cyclic-nucleotide 2'-phosphodiesterase n=1 Tax=Psittacicella hinzii TaxID=2028575 RepID=A0A3A1YN48_9GAMM|nr:bifunctional 2',3'-cyclic-nucleotide 2'-phosphodiesterase/3'-nucleotidase [Psittacicella hinzii]RIY39703.1 2',3'-cyclic-nucleotide 2'-phosphodiesterase [Psittacicella hinzii]
MTKIRTKFAKLAAAFAVLGLSAHAFADSNTIKLRVIETTDLHAYYTAYDYYSDRPIKEYGFTRTASLIEKARAGAVNSILVDNGDLIQGGMIGTWAVEDDFKSYQIHPAYLLFKAFNYDVSNLGNHEFNFGLPYLQKVVDSAQKLAGVPVINSNVYDAKTGANYYTPYIIKEHTFTAEDGTKHQIKVGYIGFTPPGIMQWDAEKLTGKVTAAPIVASAEKFIPEMKAKGAEVIVAIPHSGIGTNAPSSSLFPNQVINLTKVKDVDAVMFGHSHGVFPSEEYASTPGADIKRGTINGVPSVMPGRWGSHLGIVDLVLEKQPDGSWKANASKAVAYAEPVYDIKNRKELVEESPLAVKTLEQTHEATRAYANKPLGKIDDPLYGYLALTQDDPTVKLVNQVQMDALQNWVKENPKYANHKLVSAAAPFRYGERHNDVNGFTHVDKGPFTLRNVSDVYFYPNTFTIIEVTGKDVKNWAECSSSLFNQIFTGTSDRQELLNYNTFRTYNFDVLYGVTYQYDVTKPSAFDSRCRPSRTIGAGRVVNMQYQGQEIKDSDKFLLATNNYRANGGMFPGSGPQSVVYAALETSQELIANYATKLAKDGKAIKIDHTVNWSILPIKGSENLNVVIFSAPNDTAVGYALQNSVYPLTKLGLDYAGFQEYRIDLSKYLPENAYKPFTPSK